MPASKWIYIAIAVSTILIFLSLAGKATFRAEILIPASPEKVWSVLTDEAGYADWNPLLVPKSGEVVEGGEIVYNMTQPDGAQSDFKAAIRRVEDNRLIKQVAGLPGLLTADHEWRLEAVESGTKVTQFEIDRGLWMWFWNYEWVQPTYERVNEALKARVMEINAQ